MPSRDQRARESAATEAARRVLSSLAQYAEPDRQSVRALEAAIKQYVEERFDSVDADEISQATMLSLTRTSAVLDPDRDSVLSYVLTRAHHEAFAADRRRLSALQTTAASPHTDIADPATSDHLDRFFDRNAAAATVMAAMRVQADNNNYSTNRVVSEWLALAERSGREPSLAEVAASAGVSRTSVSRALRAFRAAVASLDHGFQSPNHAERELRVPTILGPDGTPLREDSEERRELQLRITEISEELIARLAAEPHRMYQLSPRRFEELVAELYQRRGFETHLTPSSGDAGVDVYVVRHDELGTSLSVVQCKRNRPTNRIGPGLVRELQGAMVGAGATAGVLLTTSFFTRGARALERRYRYQLSLQDYHALQALLRLPQHPTASS